MRSMTGYGKSVYSGEDYLIEFELKSVNSRFLEIRLSVPRELTFMEIELNNLIKSRINRGKVSGRLNLISFEAPELAVNQTKLRAYKQLYDKIKQETGSADAIPLQLYLENEDIIYHQEDLSKNINLKNRLIEVVNNSLDIHQESAQLEGVSMKQYLIKALEKMQKSLLILESSYPTYKTEINDRLQDSANTLFKGKWQDEELNRLALEIALYVEKSDVTEEIVRLKHHLEKFRETIDSGKDCGKTLNFILQEMHRETNTLGSKYNQNSIFSEMITIKEEIEKCREIVQNIV